MGYKYRDFNENYGIISKSDLFDAEWYSSNYDIPDNVDPLTHFLLEGISKFYNPSRDFNLKSYVEENGEDIKKGVNPLVHYIEYNADNHKLYDFDEIEGLNLKKTIRGKEDYLFLINDSNSEIRQHYDINFKNQFNYVDFIRDYYFKRYLFEKMNFKYYYFVVPDKSVVCKDFIPFKYEIIKRNADKFNFVPDFKDDLTHLDYWVYDTHINFKGAKKLAFDYLKHIDNSFSEEQYDNLISKSVVREITERHDLLSSLNWSYSEEEKNAIELSQSEVHIPRVKKLKIPDEFLKCGKRDSEYFYNRYSLTNQRVLIFRDSSTKFLKFYLSLYFRETFLYWDHFELNKELVEWFKPDVILEIRTERFIERYYTPEWLQNLISER